MVGVGGRQYATRCHECRRRKVKCDGGTPACQRCINHGLLCTGYSREHDFIFFDADAKNKPDSEEDREKKPTTPREQARKSRSTTPSGSRITAGGPSRTRALAPRKEQSLAVPQGDMGFVGVLHDRCIPDLHSVSSGQERAICSLWIAKACELCSCPDSPEMLRDAVEAFSLAVTGVGSEQNDVWEDGLRRYSRALNQLRVGLETTPISPENIDAFLVTCLCCALYEMLANRTFLASLNHLNGLGALMEGVGHEAIQSETSRLTFYHFRVIMFPTLLTTRQPTYLCKPEWINPSWKGSELHSTTHLQSLIDHGLPIPGLMAQFDSIQQSLQHTGICSPQQVYQILQKALNVGTHLDNWHEGLNEGDSTSRLYIVRLAGSTNPQEATLAAIFPISYTYPNIDLAGALMFYQMTRIFLDLFLIDIATLIQQFTPNAHTPNPTVNVPALTQSAIACADKICQSTEYFFEGNKKLIGRMGILAPFWAAKGLYERFWTTGCEADIEGGLRDRIRFCEIFAKVVGSAGLPVWGN